MHVPLSDIAVPHSDIDLVVMLPEYHRVQTPLRRLSRMLETSGIVKKMQLIEKARVRVKHLSAIGLRMSVLQRGGLVHMVFLCPPSHAPASLPPLLLARLPRPQVPIIKMVDRLANLSIDIRCAVGCVPGFQLALLSPCRPACVPHAS